MVDEFQLVCLCIDREKIGGVCNRAATKIAWIGERQVPMCDVHFPEGGTYSELNEEETK